MKKYIFRNTAIEYLFDRNEYEFSGYSDVSINDNYEEYFFCYFIEYSFNAKKITKEIEKAKYNLDYVMKNLKNKKIYVFTLYNYFYKSFVISNNTIEKTINDFNNYVYSKKDEVFVIDVKDFYNKNPNYFNSRFYYNYNAVINPQLSKEFYSWFCNYYDILKSVRKKCLIVDFDNTLWYGILGEDGYDNIKFNNEYPYIAYGEFQTLIKEVKESGVILCGATKNNEKDIMEVFNKRQDLILKYEDFTIIKSGWENKADSINEISKELNIGLDSIVFIDDNQFEINLINSKLNSVTTIQMPNNPYEFVEYFSNLFYNYFSIYNLSWEDQNRNQLYSNKNKAEELRLSSTSYEDYLRDLHMKVDIEYINDKSIDRAVQLINKSNQFNLTTNRYSKDEILNQNNENLIYTMKVEDKFGDLGICGIAIIKTNNSKYFIDDYLLSCRVLGRNLEFIFLKTIINDLRDKGVNRIYAEYKKTLKNEQVEEFYDKLGFTLVTKSKNCKKYIYEINKKLNMDKYVEVIFNGKRY